MPRPRSSVLFIHGLWLHPSSWAPWCKAFADVEFLPSAPGWPGVADTVEETRADPRALADRGIEEVADHYRRIIDRMSSRPVIVGHSFGGIIAEMLLDQGCATAAIAIGAAHINGVPQLPFSSLRSALPVLDDPVNRHRAMSLTATQFRDSFGNALGEPESDALHARWAIPAPLRPLFEAAEANFSLYSSYSPASSEPDRGPLLLVMGGLDRTVPEALAASPAAPDPQSPAAEFLEFADRGHSLTIDGGWREVADACITWLGDTQNL